MEKPYIHQLLASLEATAAWQQQFGPYPAHPSTGLSEARIAEIIEELVARLGGNYPFFHPAYAGQMLKPPHPIAWLAYTLAMTHNPNNHALDGGPPTSAMEKEVIAQLGQMFHFPEPCLGHLTTSGTTANLEALWVARELAPEKAIAYSASAHYTHSRMCGVLRNEGIAIATDSQDRMDLSALEAVLDRVGTVVVTLGTTGTGSIDPLKDILALCKPQGIRVHVDTAYGGFFFLLKDQLPHAEDWAALPEADSLVVDPHKHGLQPYGCGCVLFRDPGIGRLYKHDSPYTYFSSDELHLGEISLECSRAGAAAAALWATLRAFPPTAEGLGRILHASRSAALALFEGLQASANYIPLLTPALDIVTYYPITATPAEIGPRTEAIYRAGMQAAPARQLHLSEFKAGPHLFPSPLEHPTPVLRSTLLKPSHALYVPTILARLEALAMQTR